MSISVVIPTYNRAHIIAKAVKSVLEQTVTPLEIIVVDDHSEDNTKEIIESFKDEKIKYYLNKNSKGANGARNTGIELSQGKYIAFQDSDDLWLPEKLEKQLQYMQKHNEVDMCFSSLKLLNSKRDIIPERNVKSKEMESTLKRGNFISTQTIFIKKDIAKDNLFDEELKRFQDWDFCLRISKNHNIHHIDEALVIVEQQADSISKKVSAVESLKALFIKHPDLLDSITIKALFNRELYNENKLIGNYLKFLYYKILTKIFLRGQVL